MIIDTEKYKIEKSNFCRAETKKNQIIIDISNRKDHNHIVRLMNKDNGKSKDWNAFTISRTGEVFQHYDSTFYSKFLGIEEYDKNNISIVLENMGCLSLSNGMYYNQLNEKCSSGIQALYYNGYNYWESITVAQYEAAADLCKLLCEENSINLNLIEFNIFHKDINKNNGIVFRSNYFDNASIIAPHFNSTEFNKCLHK